MPHSIFTGRVQQPGEPLFLREDTDLAVALAEEEVETCPQCGFLRSWCRDAKNYQFSFEAAPSTCWATEALAVYQNTERYTGLKDSVRAATQLAARFRPGHEPDLLAGLGLEDQPSADADQHQHEEGH